MLQESLEPPEGRDNLEQLDALGQLVIQEVVEQLDEQEQQVSLEELGLLEKLVRLEELDLRVRQDQLE